MHLLLQIVAGTQLDSFLDKIFAWFRGPKEEEDAPKHEEYAPHEAAEEYPAESEEYFRDYEHERHAPYEAPDEDEEDRDEPDPATFAAVTGLKMKKEQEA